jgi:hypothetical protein
LHVLHSLLFVLSFFVTLQDPERPGLACIASLVAPAFSHLADFFYLNLALHMRGIMGEIDWLIAFAFALRGCGARGLQGFAFAVFRRGRWRSFFVLFLYILI